MIKDYIIYDEYIDYSGPFELKELYMIIDTFLKHNHYDKNEKKHYEKKTEEERYVELKLEPFKTVSDYIKLKIQMEIFIRNLKDLEIEKAGKKKTLQQGDLSIRFRSVVLKDYVEVWANNPFLAFLRSIIDKFFYKMHTGEFSGELVNDTRMLKESIKAFLNLYQIT
jgi:hypothetical protein